MRGDCCAQWPVAVACRRCKSPNILFGARPPNKQPLAATRPPSTATPAADRSSQPSGQDSSLHAAISAFSSWPSIYPLLGYSVQTLAAGHRPAPAGPAIEIGDAVIADAENPRRIPAQFIYREIDEAGRHPKRTRVLLRPWSRTHQARSRRRCWRKGPRMLVNLTFPASVAIDKHGFTEADRGQPNAEKARYRRVFRTLLRQTHRLTFHC